jgi:hypothetical protein
MGQIGDGRESWTPSTALGQEGNSGRKVVDEWVLVNTEFGEKGYAFFHSRERRACFRASDREAQSGAEFPTVFLP